MSQHNTIDPNKESWKPVAGWEGLYSVSNLGRIRSEGRSIHYSDGRIQNRKARIRNLAKSNAGYPVVTMKAAGRKQKTELVHRLVMQAFVGACPDGMVVCHENGDPSDNRLENLRFDSQSGNMYDKRRHGTDHEVNKAECPRGHLLEAPNLVPHKLRAGSRECLSCARAYQRVYHNKSLSGEFKVIADRIYLKIVGVKVS